jgi:hypothetical protein
MGAGVLLGYEQIIYAAVATITLLAFFYCNMSQVMLKNINQSTYQLFYNSHQDS